MVTISTNTVGPSLPRRCSPSMVHLRPSFCRCKTKGRPDLLHWKAGDKREIILRCMGKQNLHKRWIQDALQFHCYRRKNLLALTWFWKIWDTKRKRREGSRFCMAARNKKKECFNVKTGMYRVISPRHISWVDYPSDHVSYYPSIIWQHPRRSMYFFPNAFLFK